jgi:hypothetical protein
MPDDPHLGAALPGAAGLTDAARDAGAKRAEETPGRVAEGLSGSGRRGPGGTRPVTPAADAERSGRSEAVATSSALVYRPAVDAGGASARPTDRASDADSRHPAAPEPAARAASTGGAIAIWISIAIIALIFCWTAVTILSRGSHAGRGVRD